MKKFVNAQEQNVQRLTWPEIAKLLASESSTPNIPNKKLRIKLIDTIFLGSQNKNTGNQSIASPLPPSEFSPYASSSSTSPKLSKKISQIQGWYYTSTKGEITKRKNVSSLTLQHVYERFHRLGGGVCSNSVSAPLSGPRIMAMGFYYPQQHHHQTSCSPDSDVLQQQQHHHKQQEQIMHFTSEQFQREVRSCAGDDSSVGGATNVGDHSSSLSKCHALQYYARPFGEKGQQFFRGIFSLQATPIMQNEGNDVEGSTRKKDLLSQINTSHNLGVYVMEDTMMMFDDGHGLEMMAHHCADDKCDATEGGLSMHRLISGEGGASTADWIRKEIELSLLNLVLHLEGFVSTSFDHRATKNDDIGTLTESKRTETDDSITSCEDDPAVNRKKCSDRSRKTKLSGILSKARIASLSADFVLDEQKQLWLVQVTNLTVMSIRQLLDGTNKMMSILLGKNVPNITVDRSDVTDTIKSKIEENRRADIAFQNESTRIINTLNCDDENMLGCTNDKLVDRELSNAQTKHLALISSAEMEYMDRKNLDKSNVPPENNTNEVLKMRKFIARLEDELEAEKKKAVELSKAADDTTKRIKLITAKVSQVQRKAEQDLQQKDEEKRVISLDFASQLNASKAEIARLNSVIVKQGNLSLSDSDSRTGGNIHTELLQKMNELQGELTLSQRKWGEEKRALVSSRAAAEQSLAAKHRSELAEHRSTIASLEDKSIAQKEVCRSLEKEKIVLVQRLSNSHLKETSLAKECENLRSELDVMKQSLNIAQQTAAVGKKSSSDGGQIHARNDANTRMLENKIEYLKTQISSEIIDKEQYESEIAKLRKEKEKILSLYRSRNSEEETHKDKEIAKLKAELREAVEKPSQEVLELEGQIAKLRAQLGDVLQDLARSQKKEELARVDINQEQKNTQAVKEELLHAKQEFEEAQIEIERLKTVNGSIAMHEAMLRRLDNERKYLKNQLENEVSTKNDFFERLEATEKQLEEVKKSAKDEVDLFRVAAKNEQEVHESIQAQLKGENHVLKAEVQIQKDQSKEVSEAYIKVRDQLRIDQASAEQIRAASHRMAEELKAAQDELSHVKYMAEVANDRYNENSKVISESIIKKDKIRANKMIKLQEETNDALQEASKAQNQMLLLHKEVEQIKISTAKQSAVKTFISLVSKQLRDEKHHVFTSWCVWMAEDRFNELTKMEVARAVEETDKHVRKECSKVIQENLNKIQSEQKTYFERMELKIHEERKVQAIVAKEDINKAIKNERDRLNEVLRNKEGAWQRREREIHAVHQASVTRISKENNKNINALQEKTQQKIDATIKEAESSLKERQEIILRDSEKRWDKKREDIELSHKLEMENLLHNAKQEKENLLEIQKRKFLQKEKQMQEQFEETLKVKVDDAIKKEVLKIDIIVSEAVESCSVEWKKRLGDTKQMHLVDIEKLQEKHKMVIESKIIEFGKELKKSQESLRLTLEQEHKKSLEKVLCREKKQWIEDKKTEANKWELVIKETEERLNANYLEKYRKGLQECDSRHQLELKKMQESADDALSQAKKTAKEELKHAMEEHTTKIRLTKKQAEDDQSSAVRKAIENANESAKVQEQKSIEKARESFKIEKDRLVALLEKEKEHAVDTIIQREQQIIRKLKDELNEIQMQQQEERRSVKKQVEQIKKDLQNDFRRKTTEIEMKAAREFEKDKVNLEVDFNRKLSDMERGYIEQIEKGRQEAMKLSEQQIRYTKEEAEKVMNKAIETIATEHEERVQSLEYDISWMKKQKETTELSLGKLEAKCSDNNNTIEGLRRDVENVQIHSSFTRLALVSKCLGQIAKSEKVHKSKEEEILKDFGEQKRQWEDKEQTLIEKILSMEKNATNYKEQQNVMYHTLVDHKRDVLMQHKVKSREVSANLDVIAKKEHELMEERARILHLTTKMENGIRDIEKQIQEHSQISAIQGGRINISHAKHKRKLDEEYEQLLENVGKKKDDINVIEDKLRNLSGEKVKADEDMRNIERALVEVLVDQQKKLLSVVSGNNIQDN